MATYPISRLNNRKRRQTEEELSLDNLPLKRLKAGRERHPSSKLPPLAFWNNLSKIWLTETALEELDQRNAQSTPYRSPGQNKARKPRTRSAVHKLKQKSQPLIPVPEHLSQASQADNAFLKKFASKGGPDLTDLRGYSGNTMSSSSSRSKRRESTGSRSKRRKSTDPSSTSSRKSTAYDRGFEQNLVDHGVYLNNRAQTPENYNEINERLTNPRPSLSPSKAETMFKAFQASDFQAKDEDDVMIDVIPVIYGMQQKDHFLARKTKFGNLDSLTDSTIAAANPDLFYGARPEQLDRRVRDKLSSHIIPSTTEDKPMAPNFYLEAKGPDGSAAVARRQACYDGAIGARGMQSLQFYGQDRPIYDNRAYTITSTYHDGTLKMYTTHITTPVRPGKPPEYQMTQMNTWGLTGNAEAFRKGATAFRNGRDLAKEWRDGFISIANERIRSLDTEPSTLKSSVYSRPSDTTETHLTEESETSADELALPSTSLSYPVEEPEASADELVFASFLHPVEDEAPVDELSADELSFTPNPKPTASKRRLGTGSKKAVSTDLRPRSRRGRQSKNSTFRKDYERT